jgi:hypothetical protein
LLDSAPDPIKKSKPNEFGFGGCSISIESLI